MKKIFSFPCAGGAASNYDKWKKSVAYSWYSFEYKGHWTRCDEEQYVSYEEIIEDAISFVLENINKDDEIFLFGHSMGGWIAYSVAEVMEKKYFCKINAVFLSSCMTYSMANSVMPRSRKDIENFLFRVRKITNKVYTSDFFRENLWPSIENDFKMIEEAKNYLPLIESKIQAPLFCIFGREDPLLIDGKTTMLDWIKYTEATVEIYEFEGEHFYLEEVDNRMKMYELIRHIMST